MTIKHSLSSLLSILLIIGLIAPSVSLAMEDGPSSSGPTDAASGGSGREASQNAGSGSGSEAGDAASGGNSSDTASGGSGREDSANAGSNTGSQAGDRAAAENTANEVAEMDRMAGSDLDIGPVDRDNVSVNGQTMSREAAIGAIGAIADARAQGLNPSYSPNQPGIDVGATLTAHAQGDTGVVGMVSREFGTPADVADAEIEHAGRLSAVDNISGFDIGFDNVDLSDVTRTMNDFWSRTTSDTYSYVDITTTAVPANDLTEAISAVDTSGTWENFQSRTATDDDTSGTWGNFQSRTAPDDDTSTYDTWTDTWTDTPSTRSGTVADDTDTSVTQANFDSRTNTGTGVATYDTQDFMSRWGNNSFTYNSQTGAWTGNQNGETYSTQEVVGQNEYMSSLANDYDAQNGYGSYADRLQSQLGNNTQEVTTVNDRNLTNINTETGVVTSIDFETQQEVVETPSLTDTTATPATELASLDPNTNPTRSVEPPSPTTRQNTGTPTYTRATDPYGNVTLVDDDGQTVARVQRTDSQNIGVWNNVIDTDTGISIGRLNANGTITAGSSGTGDVVASVTTDTNTDTEVADNTTTDPNSTDPATDPDPVDPNPTTADPDTTNPDTQVADNNNPDTTDPEVTSPPDDEGMTTVSGRDIGGVIGTGIGGALGGIIGGFIGSQFGDFNINTSGGTDSAKNESGESDGESGCKLYPIRNCEQAGSAIFAYQAVDSLVKQVIKSFLELNTDIKPATNQTATTDKYVLVHLTLNEATRSIDVERPDLTTATNDPSLYSTDEYESLTKLLDETPILFYDDGSIAYSNGLYSPPVKDGKPTDDNAPRYVYTVEYIEKDGTLRQAQDATDENLLTSFLRASLKESSSFRINQVESVTYRLVDPDPDTSNDEFYDYVIHLTNGETRAITVPHFSSIETMTKRFNQIGYQGLVLDIVSLATETTEVPQSVIGSLFSSVSDFFTSLFDNSSSESTNDFTDLEVIIPDTGWTSSDLEKIYLYPNTPLSCYDVPGYENGFSYLAIMRDRSDPNYVNLIIDSRCGEMSISEQVQEVSERLTTAYKVTGLDYQATLNKSYVVDEETDISPGVFRVYSPISNTKTTPTTKIPDEPDQSSPTEPVSTSTASTPNLTNEIVFEVKAVGNDGTILSNWSTAESITISAGAQLYFRWDGAAYQQCLPFLNDNGNYSLTRANRAMTTGNTESEGYNISERSAVYRIECGGQRNNEFGVDDRNIEVTVE